MTYREAEITEILKRVVVEFDLDIDPYQLPVIAERIQKLDCTRCPLTGMEDPFPTHEVLNSLADATDILFHHCNYDGHGHELIKCNADVARKRAKQIKEHMEKT